MTRADHDEIPADIRDFSSSMGLKVEKLSPMHAGMLREMFKPGTTHIADYLVWGKNASKWDTRACLFWIQDLLREPEPSEHYVFLRGTQMIGMGVLGGFLTGIGEFEDSRHIQLAYWLGKKHLGNRYGDRIIKVMERIAFEFRHYSYLHVIHDSSNHTTSHMAIRLGYTFEAFYDGEIKGNKESGLYYSWVKQNPAINYVRTIG